MGGYVSIGPKMLVFGGREKTEGSGKWGELVKDSHWIRPDGTTGPGPNLDLPTASPCATLISDPSGDDVEVAVIGGATNSGDFKAMTVFNCNWKTEVCTKSSKSMGNSKENNNGQVKALDLSTPGAQWRVVAGVPA